MCAQGQCAAAPPTASMECPQAISVSLQPIGWWWRKKERVRVADRARDPPRLSHQQPSLQLAKQITLLLGAILISTLAK